jgi:hypothetical protein
MGEFEGAFNFFHWPIPLRILVSVPNGKNIRSMNCTEMIGNRLARCDNWCVGARSEISFS